MVESVRAFGTVGRGAVVLTFDTFTSQTVASVGVGFVNVPITFAFFTLATNFKGVAEVSGSTGVAVGTNVTFVTVTSEGRTAAWVTSSY